MIGGLCVHVAADMTPNAVGRQALKSSHGCVLVTRIALDERMRAQQRESILVIANRLDRCRPALHVVALLTFRSHLAAMNVGVAVSALVTHVGENRAGVTLGAGYASMHTAQRESRAAMIELRNVADRLPTGERVAVLARNV